MDDEERTDAPTLYPEPIEVAPPPGKGMLGYYRRGDNGWIITGPTTPSNRADFEYKGFTYLPQYGEFKPDTADIRAQPKAVDDRGNPWNSALEPWRLIFQRRGAHEFPVSQIIAFRWHIRPPYREVKFPQLEGVEVFDFPCPECRKHVYFSSTSRPEAAYQLRVHVTSGINDQHKYTVSDLAELGKEWEIDFFTARVRRAPHGAPEAGPSLEEGPPQPPEMAALDESEEPDEMRQLRNRAPRRKAKKEEEPATID